MAPDVAQIAPVNVPAAVQDTASDAMKPRSGDGVRALLTGSAVAKLSGPGWLRVTGEDRVRWLNGMLTNSVQTLGVGEGVYNYALSAQGRIQADAYVYALAGELRLETNRADELMALLDRFIIMDDVELARLTAAEGAAYAGLSLAGPRAEALLDALAPGMLAGKAWRPRLQPGMWNGAPVDVVQAYSPLVPRVELWGGAGVMAELQQRLLAAGATIADEDDLEDLRVLEGTPLYGVDIREKELPQETAQDRRALHFSKGCYLGQEIVERIRSRGAVHRTLAAFQLTGELPPPGTALLTGTDPAGRAAGELTSVRRIALPDGPVQLALGYVRREMLERGETLVYAGGEAVPVALPWRKDGQGVRDEG